MPKVLYIDHDLERVMEVRDELDAFNVDVSLNGWEGLGAMMLYSPDLVILNLMVPVMEGIEVIRLARTEEKLLNLPILCFTAPKDETLEHIAREMGCTNIIDVPVTRQRLVEQLHLYFPEEAKQLQLTTSDST